MPKFSYRAITETGTTTSGEIEAESLEGANNILASRGYIPTRVKAEQPTLGGLQLSSIRERFSPIKAPELILFTKQFKTMFDAGVAMMNMLGILQEQTENLKLRRILGNMHQDIKEGASLHEAFSKHKKVFPPLYCSMIRAGEASGALPEVLERLIYIIEHEHKVRSDIKSALTYPTIVVVFLFTAFLVLITQVIPKFVNIFKNAGLTLPLLGPLFRKSAVSRFASIFSILQSSGVDVLDSMDILAGTIGNAAVARELEGIKDSLAEGRGIAGPLGQAKYFTPMLINMVAIGEESGKLESMLPVCAKFSLSKNSC